MSDDTGNSPESGMPPSLTDRADDTTRAENSAKPSSNMPAYTHRYGGTPHGPPEKQFCATNHGRAPRQAEAHSRRYYAWWSIGDRLLVTHVIMSGLTLPRLAKSVALTTGLAA